MASFLQKFGFKQKESTISNNSIPQKIIHESTKEAQENPDESNNSIQEEKILDLVEQAKKDLAEQVSKDTSSEKNIHAILNPDNENLAPDMDNQDEISAEQEIEEAPLKELIKAVDLATTEEELSALMQEYEELLAGWSEKKVLSLRNEKRLKEYLSVVAALNILQNILKTPDLLKGNKISEMLQSSLKAKMQDISQQAKLMQQQNQKLQEQGQKLAKQLSGLEKSLLTKIDAIKKDPGKLLPKELQATLKNLQDSLKKVQQLKDNALKGKQINLQKALDPLKKIHAQNQKLITSGKLSEQAVSALKSLQKLLQQTAKLQKSINAQQNAQTQGKSQAALSKLQQQQRQQQQLQANLKSRHAAETSHKSKISGLQQQSAVQGQKTFQAANAQSHKAMETNRQTMQNAPESARRSTQQAGQQSSSKNSHTTASHEKAANMSKTSALQQQSTAQGQKISQAANAQSQRVAQQQQTTQSVSQTARQSTIQQAGQQSNLQQTQTPAGKDISPNNVTPINSAAQPQAKQGQNTPKHNFTENVAANSTKNKQSAQQQVQSLLETSNASQAAQKPKIQPCTCHLESVKNSKEHLSQQKGVAF